MVITSVRTYSVRWFHALAISVIAFVSIVDEDGLVWDADDVALSDARRRIITISALRVTLVVSLIGGFIARQALLNFAFAELQSLGQNVPQIKVTAKTRGGQKLRAFIVNASNLELVASITARSVRRRLLPPLKLALPKRTGVLVASLYVKQRWHERSTLGGVLCAIRQNQRQSGQKHLSSNRGNNGATPGGDWPGSNTGTR